MCVPCRAVCIRRASVLVLTVWASELMHRLNKTLVQLGCPFQARLSIGGEDEPCISAASACSVQEELLLRR